MMFDIAWYQYTDDNIPDQIDSGVKERIRNAVDFLNW